MIGKNVLIMLCGCFALQSGYSQTTKRLRAVRTDQPVKIDGKLDDEAWKQAEIGTGFLELRPVPGDKEKPGKTTEVRILYDDAAVYVAARMNDVDADSIARQVVPRDMVGNADFIGVVFDTYLDKINGVGFFVTAAGSQFDAKYSQTGNEDASWNAVWDSEVTIDDSGWSAEFKIPYSALRFSGKDSQTWGINFTRRRQKSNEQFFWNYVDPKISGFINQGGELTNIENVKAPLRLSLSPYISSYVNNYPHNQPGVKNTTSSFNGGMDVKYGINDAFTLDMTLVPDFGQVQSDNQILNLTPFEVKFDENRQFFTEGTELFNKGNLFYSRRIGSFPAYVRDINGQLNAGETVIKTPVESKLINATKVSGRTASGLGIGFFNAVTNNMNAVVSDASGNERLVENQPLTNYNILVLDQSLRNNSSVTLLNTNVLREGSAYDANVSAFLFSLNDKKNKYFVSGAAKVSHLTSRGPQLDAETGFNYSLTFGKQSGSFTWNYTHELADNKYDPSDMGFFNNNNYFDHYLNFGYNIFKPGKWYNKVETWLNIQYSERYKARDFQNFGVYPGAWIQFKNFWTINLNADWQPEANDFYEARSNGQVFRSPASYGYTVNFNTNESKPYSIGGVFSYRKRFLMDGSGFAAGTWQTYRFNDKLSLSTEVIVDPRFNYVGWVGSDNGNTIFSKYDRRTVEAFVSGRYTFSPKMGISLRTRHYWSDRKNLEFYALTADGGLTGYPSYEQNVDQNYNVFNVDMIYTWQFSPGSELSVAWKDASEAFNSSILRGYGRNFRSVMNSPQNNSVSVKLLYYLDYLQLRKRTK
ncbi:MAG TPA: DUF5916 domain-containing protein [Sphingobacteriaceae bacterium]